MRHKPLVIVGMAVALLTTARFAESCGPFLPEIRFTTHNGVLPGEFASGHPGVFRPHYSRRDLLLAYRTFSGVPFNREELERTSDSNLPSGGVQAWLQARQTVPGTDAKVDIVVDRSVPGAQYQSYQNCLDDAFASASATLQSRITQWGSHSPEVAEWVHGQDIVFQNCPAGAAIPAELNSTNRLLVADRKYQIAAARFYAEQYDQAELDFDAIAADVNSPWHQMAPYLAARVCIRQATIAGKVEKLQRATDRLRAIIADPSQKTLHASAEALLSFVLARLEPRQRLVTLGNQLMTPGLGPRLDRVLTDYTTIWDRLESKQERPPTDASEVAGWIALFQQGGDATGKWRAKRSLPWLVAALVHAAPGDPSMQELLDAARQVTPDSPAYATVSYYGILQQIRAGDRIAARKWVDEALTAKQQDSVTNMLRAERLNLALDWTEFLRFAPRKPVLLTYDGSSDSGSPDEALNKKVVAFDADSVRPLNQATPLKLWIDAAESKLIPRGLQAEIAQAGWVRAVILDDRPTANRLAVLLRQLEPKLAVELNAYLAAIDPATAKFEAVYLMLRGPGLTPVLRPGLGRETPSLRRDVFRDNWWRLSRLPLADSGRDGAHEALYDLYPDGNWAPPDFLPTSELTAGEQQWKRLVHTADNGVNYLCAEVIAWAKSHPQDARVPRALHLAVEATRYGPADRTTRVYSHKAFDLLHARYPNSEWTAKTRYWY